MGSFLLNILEMKNPPIFIFGADFSLARRTISGVSLFLLLFVLQLSLQLSSLLSFLPFFFSPPPVRNIFVPTKCFCCFVVCEFRDALNFAIMK